MSKVSVDRELPERIARDDEGAASLADFEELKRILAQPAEAEGVAVVGVVCISRFKNNPAMENVEFHLAADLPQGQHEVILHSSHLAALSAVTAERDAALASLERAYANYNQVSYASTERGKQIDQLRAEVEALRKDAERYRWLRDEAQWLEGVPQVIQWCSNGEPQEIISDDELDEAIDAAMAAKEARHVR